MRKWLAMLRPSPWVAHRMMVAAALVGVGVGAFCLGRQGTLPEADAQALRGQGPALQPVAASPNYTTAGYNQRVVAYVYDNIPISREELGEYLIARFGAERVEFLINRKIVEMACKAKGVDVSDAEVEGQLADDVRSFGPTMKLDDFVNQVLKRFNKTLYEWKEDVIRPKLAMSKLVRPTVVVSPEDVQKDFEAHYGPKVQCRMIVIQKDTPQARCTEIWKKASESEASFKEVAGEQFIPELKARKGEIPPIHKHFPDKKIEEEAFSLKVGQVSSLMELPDHSWVILRCEAHIPPDQSKRLETERMALSRELFERKLATEIPLYFQKLRQQANPRNMLATHGQPPGGPQAPPPAVSSAPQAAPPVVSGAPQYKVIPPVGN